MPSLRWRVFCGSFALCDRVGFERHNGKWRPKGEKPKRRKRVFPARIRLRPAKGEPARGRDASGRRPPLKARPPRTGGVRMARGLGRSAGLHVRANGVSHRSRRPSGGAQRLSSAKEKVEGCLLGVGSNYLTQVLEHGAAPTVGVRSRAAAGPMLRAASYSHRARLC